VFRAWKSDRCVSWMFYDFFFLSCLFVHSDGVHIYLYIARINYRRSVLEDAHVIMFYSEIDFRMNIQQLGGCITVAD